GNGRHRPAGSVAWSVELDGYARDRRVVRRLDDGDEVVRAQDRVLRDDARAHALRVGVDLADSAWPPAEDLAPRLGQRAQHGVGRHDGPPPPFTPGSAYQTGDSRLDALRNI